MKNKRENDRACPIQGIMDLAVWFLFIIIRPLRLSDFSRAILEKKGCGENRSAERTILVSLYRQRRSCVLRVKADLLEFQWDGALGPIPDLLALTLERGGSTEGM